MDDSIEIPLSKQKIILLLIAAIAFVVMGVFLALPLVSETPLDIELANIVGLVTIIFFGTCAVFMTTKLFDKKVGLTIDQYGITDNTSGTSVGLIEWADITESWTIQIASTKILMIATNTPEKYIERAKNSIAKRAMKANYKIYGSPIAITASALKIKYSDLERLINTELEKRKGTSS
ncbi:MAG: STM3941 family protein [Thermonemataceae bacterium]|mgnify:CR=1 FL=1